MILDSNDPVQDGTGKTPASSGDTQQSPAFDLTNGQVALVNNFQLSIAANPTTIFANGLNVRLTPGYLGGVADDPINPTASSPTIVNVSNTAFQFSWGTFNAQATLFPAAIGGGTGSGYGAKNKAAVSMITTDVLLPGTYVVILDGQSSRPNAGLNLISNISGTVSIGSVFSTNFTSAAGFAALAGSGFEYSSTVTVVIPKGTLNTSPKLTAVMDIGNLTNPNANPGFNMQMFSYTPFP